MADIGRGRHTRDPAVPPPVDAELTRLSLRWTFRALTVVVAVWFLAGAVGAWCDLWGRYGELDWVVLLAGRGSGGVWHLTVSRGHFAAFALGVTGVALVASAVGTWQLVTAAQSGSPHRGPSRWSIAGVVIAVGVGVGIAGCFVVAELWSPSSDAVLVPATAPELLGVFAGSLFASGVRRRFDPWRWQERTSSSVRPRAEGAPHPSTVRPAPGRPGAGGWPAALAREVRNAAVGVTPAIGTAHPPAPRAARVSVGRVQVTPAGVSWSKRRGGGFIPAGQVAAVLLADMASAGSVVVYGLVLDAGGAALLRVSAGGGGPAGTQNRRRLTQLWQPLDVPVSRYYGPASRAKDLRRRWPEAFSWLQAYPGTAMLVVVLVWITVVVPLGSFLGSR